MESFLLQATIYLAAIVFSVPIARRLGLGSVLGYLGAGLLIGPVLGLVGTETRELQHFAEFGVVMMLFLVGLELDPTTLWAMRGRLVGLGAAQIFGTTAAIALAGIALGQPHATSVAVGMAFSVSSTAIVLQTLTEKGLMRADGGQSALAVLLAQDIAVVPMLAILPLLAVQGLRNPTSLHGTSADEAAHSLMQGLPGWGVTLVTLGAVGAVVALGIFAARPLFRFVATTHLREVYTATALFVVISIAALMVLVGLSPALGAFLAGVVLANSEFRHELHADIEPFKGLLLGLFFITVGAGIDLGLLQERFSTILSLTLGLIAIKALVLAVLARMAGLRGRDGWLFTLGLAQAGEFAFVLLAFMLRNDVLTPEQERILLIVVAMSMLLTPLLFLAYDLIARRIARGAGTLPADEIDETGPIIIAGVGRFGQVINRLVGQVGLPTVVLDGNMATIQAMRKFGLRSFFGDPARPDLLHAAGLMQARVLVVAVDDPEAALRIVRHARRERPDLHIVARARDRHAVYALYQAGANDIVRETFDSSVRAGRYVLQAMGMDEDEAEDIARRFVDRDRIILRELAKIWDPRLRAEDNPAYVRRVRELNTDRVTWLAAHDPDEVPEAEPSETRDEAGSDVAPGTGTGA